MPFESISGKHQALVAIQGTGNPVAKGTVEKVFAEAAKKKETAAALKNLLHFGGPCPAATKDARLRARLALVGSVAEAMRQGLKLSDALALAQHAPKAQLARDCANGYTAPRLDLAAHQRLHDQLQTLDDRPAHRTAESPEKLVGDHRQVLARFVGYACTDIGAFQGNINSQLSSKEQTELFERLQAMQTNENRMQASSGAEQAVNMRPMKSATVANVARSVDTAQAGCCSSFALAAAHVLTGGQRDPQHLHPRVEVVSCGRGFGGTHCYVIVGRDARSQLSDSRTWGDGVRIVDPWAASLGHGDGIFTLETFPFPQFLEPDQVIYSSYEQDQELAINPEAASARRLEALRKRGFN